MATEFKLPELGENIEEAQVVSVNVAKGDSVEADQEVVEVETDKAVMPVPIDQAGTIQQVMVSEGDTLKVGQTILTVDGGGGEASGGGESEQAAEAEAEGESESKQATAVATEPAPAEQAEASAEAGKGEAEAPEAQSQPAPAEESETSGEVKETRTTEPAPVQPGESDQRTPVFAAPSVRRFAREVGVDITQVRGSGPGGRIGMNDVKSHARHVTSGNGQVAATASPRLAAPPLPDFAKEGPVERKAMSMIAKKTAQHMATCWANIPHVTLHEYVDVTDLESFRQANKGHVQHEGGKLTVTAILVKLTVAALKQFPTLNCSYDSKSQELIFKQYYNIGVAADTPRGLVVPVLRDADRKSLTEISVELTDLAKQARDGKLALEQMQGGTFTITNLGGIGVSEFTPIVNHPEVAILGVGTARDQVVEVDNGRYVKRSMMPLSLSFDHRVVNGADGARFLTWVKNAIEHPLGALLS